MTEFQQGDQLIGIHGSIWTRDDQNKWWSESRTVHISDDTAQWCLELNLKSLPPSPPTGPVKISKSEKTTHYPEWLYKWTGRFTEGQEIVSSPQAKAYGGVKHSVSQKEAELYGEAHLLPQNIAQLERLH
jgi:hypothetical protein